MAEKVEEAMHEALSSLASLQEKVEKSGEDTENIRNTIDLLNDAISQKKDENNYIEGAQSVVRVAKSFGDNYDKFTSGDALEIASGAIALIDTIGGVVGGPYGPLITGVCGLIASILPLFGGKKGPSMSEVVDKVIREALDDFRKEEIYGKVIGSLNEMTLHITLLVSIASQNSGHLSTAEQSFLTTTDFTTVAIDTLGVLQGQIEKYESIKNDEKKSQSISLYAYFYCMVSIQRTVIMNLYCSLLRANDMEAIFAGVKEYLFEVLPKKDLKVFEFMSMLPSSKNWWMLYRCLHTTLTAQQRGILCAYTKQIGCPPMIGKLCYLYNDVQNEYMYLPQNHLSNDSSRRNVFTWRRKTCDNAQYLFRLIGDNNNCQIFGVYFGEYIYAADAIHTTAIEGECFPGDLALLHQWVIGKSLVKPFEISTRVNICMLPTLELTMEIEDLY